MNLHLLELQRARKCLEVFCRRRNGPGRAGPEWVLSRHDNEFLISEYSAASANSQPVPILCLCFDNGRWLLSVPSTDGGWQSYPPRPEVGSIDAVIEELEQAPLHVHWG